MRNMPGK